MCTPYVQKITLPSVLSRTDHWDSRLHLRVGWTKGCQRGGESPCELPERGKNSRRPYGYLTEFHSAKPQTAVGVLRGPDRSLFPLGNHCRRGQRLLPRLTDITWKRRFALILRRLSHGDIRHNLISPSGPGVLPRVVSLRNGEKEALGRMS